MLYSTPLPTAQHFVKMNLHAYIAYWEPIDEDDVDGLIVKDDYELIQSDVLEKDFYKDEGEFSEINAPIHLNLDLIHYME